MKNCDMRSAEESEKVFHRLLLADSSRAKRSLRKSFSDCSLADLCHIVRLVRIQKTQIKRSRCC